MKTLSSICLSSLILFTPAFLHAEDSVLTDQPRETTSEFKPFEAMNPFIEGDERTRLEGSASDFILKSINRVPIQPIVELAPALELKSGFDQQSGNGQAQDHDDELLAKEIQRREEEQWKKLQRVTVTKITGEFEEQAGIVLAYRDLAEFHPGIMLELVQLLQGRVKLYFLVNNQTERDFIIEMAKGSSLPTHGLQFVWTAHDTMWVRDYCPIAIDSNRGSRSFIDSEYSWDRPMDDQVSQAIGQRLAKTVYQVPLTIDGGNFLTNGQGIAIATQDLVVKNQDRGYTESTLRALLEKQLSLSRLVILEQLIGEPTGHVDMFSTFVSANVVLVGEYDPKVDPENAAILNRNAAKLAQVRTNNGNLKVVRIPMPTKEDGFWRSYTNLIYANGVVIVPSYFQADPKVEQHAFEIIGKALPGWSVQGVDATSLIENGGALHCISWNLPANAQLQKPLKLETLRVQSKSPILKIRAPRG